MQERILLEAWAAIIPLPEQPLEADSVACQLLPELLDRSLIMRHQPYSILEHRTTFTYQMHDVLRDHAALECEKTNRQKFIQPGQSLEECCPKQSSKQGTYPVWCLVSSFSSNATAMLTWMRWVARRAACPVVGPVTL